MITYICSDGGNKNIRGDDKKKTKTLNALYALSPFAIVEVDSDE